MAAQQVTLLLFLMAVQTVTLSPFFSEMQSHRLHLITKTYMQQYVMNSGVTNMIQN